MSDLPLKIRLRNALNEAGPKALPTPTTPNRNPNAGGSGMTTADQQYGDSTPKIKNERGRA